MFSLKFGYRIIWGRLHVNLFQWYGHPIRFNIRIIPKEKKMPHLKVRTREELKIELHRMLSDIK